MQTSQTNTEIEADIEKDLFGHPIRESYNVEVLPVSVIDIEAQKKRSVGGHNANSSRSEYSPFPKEVASLCMEYYMRNANVVFDPFAGWGERGQAAAAHQKQYIGYDISQAAIDEAASRGVKNILADSRTSDIPRHDGLVTCPPYWNLEKYAGGGLSDMDSWSEFLRDYSKVLSRSWDMAESGSMYCIMVGEWRSSGVFYDLEYQTRKIMDGLGAVIFDQVVISRKQVSKIKVMLPQAKRLGYTVRVHESLLVFLKK